MNPIYRGQYPPKNTNVLWIKDNQIYIYQNGGWTPSSASIDVDDTMVPDSTNPVQSKVIQDSLGDLETELSQQIGGKQDLLTFDTNLSDTSPNPIKNSAVYKQYMTEDDIDDIIVIVDPSKAREVYKKKYLTFTLKNTGKFYPPSYSGTNAKMYYSLDGGNTWTQFTSTINNIPAGTKIMFKGENITKFTSKISCYTSSFDISGNILSLFYGDTFRNQTSLPATSYACQLIFNESGVIDASNLILPDTAVPEYGYYRLFRTCNQLTKAPVLPATTVGDRGYYEMFSLCTSLVTAPEIAATTMGKYTCSMMFYNCSSLVNAPELLATFSTGSVSTYEGVYSSMFKGCTALETAPVLISTRIPEYGYSSMFQNCSSLKYIKCLGTDITWSAATSGWVSGVGSSGTFVQASGVSWGTGVNGIPTGWTVESV